MGQFQYAFIVKAPGYGDGAQTAVMASEAFQTRVVGVGSVEEAGRVARELVKEGVTLLELCSGFKAADAQQVLDAVDGPVKIGFVGTFLEK